MSPAEVRASVHYYAELGRLMGIKDVPQPYDDFAALMDAEHFQYDVRSRRVADATLRLLSSFYPRILARPVDAFSRALMDDPLLEAFA